MGARGSKARKIAEGRCVRAIVGRSPSFFDTGEARSDEMALMMNGMVKSEERRVTGAWKRE